MLPLKPRKVSTRSEAMLEQLDWRPRRTAKQTLVCHALCHRKRRELTDQPAARSLEKACPLVERE